MYTVYILYSPTHKKIYTGYTSNLIQRFYSHNLYATKGWSKNYRPWIVVYIEIFATKGHAIKREQELKSGKGRDWIKHNFDGWLKEFG